MHALQASLLGFECHKSTHTASLSRVFPLGLDGLLQLLHLLLYLHCCTHPLTRQSCLSPRATHTRMHAHTHTHARTHTHACTHAHTRADTDRQTQTRTHTHCSADICMSFCVSLTPQQGKAAVMSWECADSLFAFLFVFCVFDFLELLP